MPTLAPKAPPMDIDDVAKALDVNAATVRT